MSLHLQEIPPVPEETRRVALAAFPRGDVYMRLRDELGAISDDQLLATSCPARGQPAASPSRPLYNLPRACPTAKRPTRCAAASTENMC
jgi:transposase